MTIKLPLKASMLRLSQPSSKRKHRKERGVALFVVIVFVMMSMLLALWASRTALFNELIVGNDADYQRAFESAQALLQDAELDIRRENADGSVCTPSTVLDVCRTGAAIAKIPVEAKDVGQLVAFLGSQTTRCSTGLCAKRTGRQDFWNYTAATSPAPSDLQAGEVRLEQYTVAGVGARYGQYTGAVASMPANPILANTSAANRGGWYWIEVLPYDESSKSAGLIVGDPGVAKPRELALNLIPNVVYRITALAYGNKLRRVGSADVPVTSVVLQQTYAIQKLKD